MVTKENHSSIILSYRMVTESYQFGYSPIPYGTQFNMFTEYTGTITPFCFNICPLRGYLPFGTLPSSGM